MTEDRRNRISVREDEEGERTDREIKFEQIDALAERAQRLVTA